MSTTSVMARVIRTNAVDTTMKTGLCHMLGIEYPIVAAPMGPDLTGPETVAAVSNAGGLGILQAQFCAPSRFRAEIHRVRALTDKPFGVNLLLHFPVEEQLTICLEEHIPVLSLFWGDPTPYVERAHAAGVKVFHQVGSVSDAQRAARAGVDVVITGSRGGWPRGRRGLDVGPGSACRGCRLSAAGGRRWRHRRR